MEEARRDTNRLSKAGLITSGVNNTDEETYMDYNDDENIPLDFIVDLNS